MTYDYDLCPMTYDLWTYGPMDLWTYGPMDLWTYGPMEIWKYGLTEVKTDEWKDYFTTYQVSIGRPLCDACRTPAVSH